MFHRKKIVFFLRSFEQLVQNQSVWRNHGYRALYFLKRNKNFNLRFLYILVIKKSVPLSSTQNPLSSIQGPHLYSTKNSSVQHNPQFNTKTDKKLSCVLNWGVFGVELRDFWGWKGVVHKSNWWVELRGSVWNWGVLLIYLNDWPIIISNRINNWSPLTFGNANQDSAKGRVDPARVSGFRDPEKNRI